MAEQLINEFTVNRSIDEAWPLICDLEKIAPCMPGAQLEEVEGDVYRGNVAIKLGSVATKFKGEAQFVERDDTNHTAELQAQGRDSKGRGNAKAHIAAQATALSPTSTLVKINTDLSMAGRVAQFGRGGIMADVSRKLVDQFASNLNQMIDEQPHASGADAMTNSTTSAAIPSDAKSPIAASSKQDKSGNQDDSGQGQADGKSAADEPKVRKIDGPAAEPIEVTELAGAALAKRAVPAGIAVVAVLWLLRKLFR